MVFLAAILAAQAVAVLPMPVSAAGVTFRATSSGSNLATATLQLSMPAGVVSGDVLVAGISVRGKPTISPPAGWTLVVDNVNGTTMRQAIYVHAAGGSEPASATWTFSKAGSASGGIAAYSGVDPVSPIDAAAGQTNGSSSTITAPSITATVAGDLLVAFFGTARTTDIVPMGSLTERYDVSASSSLKFRISSDAADEPLAVTGATGIRTASANGASASIGQLIALRPGSPPPPDTTPPTVTTTSPTDGATGVPVSTNVTATFSEAVTGVSGSSFTLTGPGSTPVTAAVTYSSASLTATLAPSSNLEADTSYTASLSSAIKDGANNPLSPVTWTFHTATAPPDTTPPTVTDETPVSGATAVAVATTVTATFSEAVNGVSVSSFTLSGPGGPVTASVTYTPGNLTATLDPSADLAFGTTYQASLTSAITDLAGNPLAPVAWSFTTVAAPDTTPPTVTNVSPADGATSVIASTNVSATFSETVTGVSGSSFTLSGPGGAVAAPVSYDAGSLTATLDPATDLAADTTYTASLSSAITDTANNPLNPLSWSFHTAAAPPPPSSIAFRSAATGFNAATATIVLPNPSGVVSGDVLLALVSVRGGPTITAPAGWMLVVDTQNGSTMRQAIYAHTAGSSEPSSYTFSFSKDGSASGGIAAYVGVDPVSPIDSAGGLAATSSATVTAPSITTKTSNTRMVGYFGSARTTTFAESASMTERFDVSGSTTVTYKISSAAADEAIANAGPTGIRTATASGSSGNIGQVVALRAAGAPPGADFDAVPTSGVVPLTVTFRDMSGGSPTAWAWDFDSNGVVDSTARNPTFVYTTVGAKTVTLTVTGTTGNDSETKSGFVLVDPVPASSPSDPILSGAGDIASCASTGDEATANLLDSIGGTVFTAGDNAYESGTATEFANCYDPSWGRHKARTRPAIGDHDVNSGSTSAYFAYFGANAGDPTKGYYSYDLGTWHIVVLNTECTLIGGCGIGSAQETWLKQDLAANASACTLAYWHNPLFSSLNSGPLPDVKAFWDDLLADGAELIINGDKHVYERFAPQDSAGNSLATGIREFVVGTGGRSHHTFVTTAAHSEARDSTSYGVLKLTLHATGYTWQFVPVAGAQYTDSGQAACH